MEPKHESEEDLNKEFKTLGKTIVNTFQSFIQSSQMKNLQVEIESGLSELSNAIKDSADQVISSPATQQIKTSVNNAKESLNSDEWEAKIRKEIAYTLRKINNELEKFSDELDSETPDESNFNKQNESRENVTPENNE